MINIFETKQYPVIMYLAITIITLLILFNLTSIFENNKQLIQKNNEKRIITGLLIAEQQNKAEQKTDPKAKQEAEQQTNQQSRNQTSTNQEEQQELYTEKSYFIYYLLITSICGFIFILSLKFILPKIKKYT